MFVDVYRSVMRTVMMRSNGVSAVKVRRVRVFEVPASGDHVGGLFSHDFPNSECWTSTRGIMFIVCRILWDIRGASFWRLLAS